MIPNPSPAPSPSVDVGALVEEARAYLQSEAALHNPRSSLFLTQLVEALTTQAAEIEALRADALERAYPKGEGR